MAMRYDNWKVIFRERAFMLVPAQQEVKKLLATFKDFPPRQKASSFTVDQASETLDKAHGD